MTASSPGLYYGWYVVAAAFSVMLLGFGCAYSFSAFFPELSREFEASRASISLIFSIGGALYFGLGAVSGPLSDRYGPRWICVFGLVTLGLGLIFAALSDDLFGVYLGFGVGIGVGIGFSYVPSIGAVQPWFTERRGFASGLAVSGIGVGTFVGPLIASVLIAMFDWRTALIVLGLTALTLGSVAALFLDNDPVARGVREPGTSANASLDDASFTLREAIRARPFWLLFTASGCLSFAIFVPFVHLVPYALDHGLTATAGAALIGLVGVGSTFGRFVVGTAADRLGRAPAFSCCFIGVVLMFFLWLMAKDIWLLGVFAVVFGTCYGGFVALAPSLVVDYFGAKSVGAIIGLLYSGVGVGTLLGPTVAGYLFDQLGSYQAAILAGELAAAIGAGLTLLLPTPRTWRAAQRS